jgi:hypothetical protein
MECNYCIPHKRSAPAIELLDAMDKKCVNHGDSLVVIDHSRRNIIDSSVDN